MSRFHRPLLIALGVLLAVAIGSPGITAQDLEHAPATGQGSLTLARPKTPPNLGPLAVRVSAKRVRSPSTGEPHPLWTDSRLHEWVAEASQLFEEAAGVQLELVEIADIDDPVTPLPWYDLDPDDKPAMEAEAQADPPRFMWRDKAVNVYFVGNIDDFGGYCSFPDAHENEDDMILVAPDILNGSMGLAHEFGHYFWLYHTFETFLTAEQHIACQAVSPICEASGDIVCDTPADPNDLSLVSAWYGCGSCFGCDSDVYKSLRYNIMTYYSNIKIHNAVLTEGQARRIIDALTWYRHDVMYRPSKWTDLGYSLDGALGTPRLVGAGLMVHDLPIYFEVSNVVPNSTGFFAVGLVRLDAQIFGGTLVPHVVAPWGDVAVLPTSGGSLDLTGTWIHIVPPGSTLYFQFWTYDAAAPFGLSATNALEVQVPK